MIKLVHPNYKVPLKNLERPYQLVSNFKQLDLQNYCYAFWVKDYNTNTQLLMNIGMSTGGRIGDRIYRKVGNLPGWGKNALTGDRGADMKLVVKAVEERFEHLGLKIHKDDVVLHIWDTNNLVVESFNSPTVEAEKKLFRDCKEKFGCIPAGNWQDPNDRNKEPVSKQQYNMFFEEEKYEA